MAANSAASAWFTSFDEVRTRSTESTSGHAATAPVNAQSIELRGFHVAEQIVSNFSFEENAELGLTNARAMHATHDHFSANHEQAVERLMANLGVAWAARGDPTIVGEAGEHSVAATRHRRARIRNILRCPRWGWFEERHMLGLGGSFHFNDKASAGLD
jgi:hypothetical protein